MRDHLVPLLAATYLDAGVVQSGRILVTRCVSCFLFALFLAAPAAAQESVKGGSSAKHDFNVETVAQGLEHPWAVAFLPDGRALITERPGRLRILSRDRKLSEPVAGVPRVAASGQGGLLDVALAPDFEKSRRIFFTYAEPRDGQSGTAVAHARLAEEGGAARLEDLQVIFRQQPAYSGGRHFGSRLAFAPDGNLFVTLGERGQMDPAQDLSNHIGKVVRIRPDGSVPQDNPFAGRKDARPEIWSYGHRNPQSAAIHPESGRLWTVEHGPRGGDALIAPEAGKNYGWPEVSYGMHYSGVRIPDPSLRPEFAQPLYHWTPSIAPSGMAFYTGDAFPNWRGSLFVGALVLRHLNRLELAGEKVVNEERLLTGLRERIRDVRQAPDGTLWLLTDARTGQVLRLSPVK
jgi:glucose/arabinose dehydrogenase